MFHSHSHSAKVSPQKCTLGVLGLWSSFCSHPIDKINQNKTKDIDSLIEKYLVKLKSQCLSEDEMKHMQTLNKEKGILNQN